MYYKFLILYRTVSRDSWEARFPLVVATNRPSDSKEKFCSLQISLMKQQKNSEKAHLMRILQRRAWLPTLITSYGDHDTLRARLCFSYAPSSQPTFDSHSQDCLLSFCVLIKEPDSPCVFTDLSTSPERVEGLPFRWFETPASQFSRSMGTAGCR